MTRDPTASLVSGEEIERLKKYGLEPHDVIRLERALCTLGDYEGPIKKALAEIHGGRIEQDHANVCYALRRLIGE
jgi:hypothetical protein